MLGLMLAAAVAVQDPTTFTVPSADGYVISGQTDRPAGPVRGAVVMVAGTGAFDRDVALGRTGTARDRIFADLGPRFAARGMTAVRYDRRGVRYGVPPAETIDAAAAPSVTAENLSRDVEAVYDWARSPQGLNARCVVVFVHSEGSAHLAGVAERGVVPQPRLIIGMGAAMESKVSAVRWQMSGRDAYSLVMMDENGDGSVTNDEVRANWLKTPSGMFGRLEPFMQPDGVWTPEDIEQVRMVQGGMYEAQKTAALAMGDADPYPGAAAPAFSGAWWKSWFTDDTPIAQRFAAWSTPMILHYGTLDSQVREDRQRAAVQGVLPDAQVTWITHADRGHSLGTEHLFGPVDEAIADQIADEAAAACG
ncbi:MAG: hypothetical protein V4707_10735 [Pseudomonadota bacterium]